MARCQAVWQKSYRYKIELLQRCQQTAIHHIDGADLCGTHVNALHNKALQVVRELAPPE